MADIERLDRALDYIERHPEQHDQGVWMRGTTADGKVDCGTAACLAGWVVAQAHPDAVFVPDKLDLSPRMRHIRMHSAVRIGDQVEPVADQARKLLDINEYQAQALFSAGNDLGDLRRMRNLLAEDPDVSGGALADEGGDYDDDYDGTFYG
jgi:hypothetical protein